MMYNFKFFVTVLVIVIFLNMFDVVHLPCNSLIYIDLPPTSCTVFHIYYTKLLHVSAIYPGHLQGATSLPDVYGIYGNLSYVTGRLYTYIYNI
jgi:hypothetical protein